MNFKKYDEIINNNKYDMLFMIIYYNLKCNENLQLDYINLDNKPHAKEQLQLLIQFIYKAYLKDESHIDLSLICDKAVEYKNEILKNSIDAFTTWNLLEKCYECI